MRRIILLLSLVLLFLPPRNVVGFERPPTPQSLVGETLEFRVRWGVIPAGRAVLAVEDGGDGRITFRAEARTLPYIDAIYPVRDRIVSTSLLDGARLLRYSKRSKEGWGDPQKVEVVFDTDSGTARYFEDGHPKKTIRVPSGVQDPLSCFYAYRSLELPGEDDVDLAITDGKKVVTGVVSVVGRERVETPAGVFSTVIVEPKIEGIGGIFKKSPNARILLWLTDDEWRRPVKLQSKVVVGHFTAELVDIRHPAASPQAQR